MIPSNIIRISRQPLWRTGLPKKDICAKSKARQEQQNPSKRKVAKEKVHTAAPTECAKRATSIEPSEQKQHASYVNTANHSMKFALPDGAGDKSNFQSAPHFNASASRAAVRNTFSAIAPKNLTPSNGFLLLPTF
eukprot:scaffold116609_cov39-Cyclotella_meneghiniana.AAC.2